MQQHYVYCVYNTITKIKYIGVRTAVGLAERDLWIKYFTSSKHVEKALRMHPKENWTHEILSRHGDRESAELAERRILKAIHRKMITAFYYNKNFYREYTHGLAYREHTACKITQRMSDAAINSKIVEIKAALREQL